MNPRRLLVALLTALLLSGAATHFLTRRINGRNGRSAAPATQKYVAASRPLPAGELLKPENLTLVDWPAKMPLPGAFSKMEDVSGRAVVYPMVARQPVLEGYLAAAGSGIGLTVKIPDGMRAASSEWPDSCSPVVTWMCWSPSAMRRFPVRVRKSFCRMLKCS